MILPRIVCSSGSVSSPNLSALARAVDSAAFSVQAQFYSHFLDEPSWSAAEFVTSDTQRDFAEVQRNRSK